MGKVLTEVEDEETRDWIWMAGYVAAAVPRSNVGAAIHAGCLVELPSHKPEGAAEAAEAAEAGRHAVRTAAVHVLGCGRRESALAWVEELREGGHATARRRGQGEAHNGQV